MAFTTPSTDRPRTSRLRLPSRRTLLWALTGVLYLAGVVYFAALSFSKQPPSHPTLVTVNGLLVLGAALAYLLLGDVFRQRDHNAMRSLWSPMLISGIALITAVGTVALTGGAGPVDARTLLPEGPRTLVQAIVVGTMEITSAFVLLLYLRTLVLFKRTRHSVRNWNLMVVAMVVAALTMSGERAAAEAAEQNIAFQITGIVAMGLMVANAFRLSWIVFLSFREKWATIGLCIGLIGVTAFVMNNRFGGYFSAAQAKDGLIIPDAALVPLPHIFSQPLSQFALFVFAFAILYATTAILSLLFHLPTASAFEQKTGEMEAMQALAELSGQVLDREKLVQTIADAPVQSGGADAAWVALVDPESGSLTPQLAATRGIDAERIQSLLDERALTQDVFERRRPLVLNRAAADHRVRTRPGNGLGSLLALPLTSGGETRGVLFASKRVAEGFEQDDVSALTTFAAQAALSLANADLFAEVLEKERLAQELEIAREVQKRLLPQTLPQFERVEIAGLGFAAMEVGGDYYDVAVIGEQCVGVIVADVSGKGTAAAFYMAELKGIFQSVSRLTRSPAEFLVRANEALTASLGKQAFISALYGVLDTQSGVFTYARAGHCPAALARADGEARLLRAQGIGLGLTGGPLFEKSLAEETVQLRPGDALALYTDGVVESRAPDGEEYGYDRLLTTVVTYRAATAQGLLDGLLEDCRTFSDHKADLDDDLTLVALKWHGEAGPPTPLAAQKAAPTSASGDGLASGGVVSDGAAVATEPAPANGATSDAVAPSAEPSSPSSGSAPGPPSAS
ncbi:MAG: GAF domain-containing SpoIIE family protein phosphatase [Bacteroidota bacterium]